MLSIIVAALLASEATPAASPPQPPAAAPSLQAQFDAANAAEEAGSFDDAIKRYESLEQLPKIQKNPLVLSTILLRKGMSLLELSRPAQAESTLRAGLKIVPLDRPELRKDRFLAEHGLGLIAMVRLDYAEAVEQFKRALPLADEPASRAVALLSLSRATTFDPGDDAISYADQALAIATTLPSKDQGAKKGLADIQTIRAGALMNHGRTKEAFDVLKKAVSEQGGLNLRVDFHEIVTRSDLAIAALLLDKKEEAREYLAYTGAGRMKDAPFRLAARMNLPPCGGPANLQPEDVAVVEFSINPDGSVAGARPIYASVNGPAALEFARVVSGWSWRPTDVARIPELFRDFTRIELRCSTNAARPPLDETFAFELAKWLTESHVDPVPKAASDAAAMQLWRAELAKREATGGSLSTIPVLLCLAANPIAPFDERLKWLTRARDIAQTAGAPIGAVMALETRLAMAHGQWTPSTASIYRDSLRALLARPGVSDNVEISDTLKIMIADPQYMLSAPSDATTLLQSVADDSRLSSRHQLRIAALVRLAAIQAQAGDTSTAAATYQRTGLEARQCALLDSSPVLLKSNSGSSDFPAEAQQWGFEGWVRTEYDILADGKTASQRPIVAYPPFVFRDAALGITKKLEYAKSYRPDGSAGCSGAIQNINFILPYQHGG